MTAALATQHEATVAGDTGPEEEPTVIDFIANYFAGAPLEEVARPHCPRTRRSLADHEAEYTRHGDHRKVTTFKENARRRRGHGPLTEAQHRALFGQANTIEEIEKILVMVEGHELKRREKAQVKFLRKRLSGKNPRSLESRTYMSKDDGMQPVRRRNKRVPKRTQPRKDNGAELDLSAARSMIFGDDTIYVVADGVCFIPA